MLALTAFTVVQRVWHVRGELKALEATSAADCNETAGMVFIAFRDRRAAMPARGRPQPAASAEDDPPCRPTETRRLSLPMSTTNGSHTHGNGDGPRE